mgnify:FL=1
MRPILDIVDTKKDGELMKNAGVFGYEVAMEGSRTFHGSHPARTFASIEM